MHTPGIGARRSRRGGSLLLAAALLSALDTMERHALVRDEVDWPKLRRDTLGRAEGASGPADTHEAIEQALGGAGRRPQHLPHP
ncbi:hypothetical protein ACWEJQ_12790 [Streptomyces albidoflavus]